MAYTANKSPNPSFDPFVLIKQNGIDSPTALNGNCGSENDIFDNFGTAGEFDSDWVVVGKVENPLNVTPEDNTIETTDGSEVVTSEGITFSGNDLAFTASNWQELRDNVHRQSCDIALVDPSDLSNSVLLLGVVLKVMPDIQDLRKSVISGKIKDRDMTNFFKVGTLSTIDGLV